MDIHHFTQNYQTQQAFNRGSGHRKGPSIFLRINSVEYRQSRDAAWAPRLRVLTWTLRGSSGCPVKSRCWGRGQT